MEKLKALIAVTLFIAALLFVIGNENNTNKASNQQKAVQTVVVNKW